MARCLFCNQQKSDHVSCNFVRIIGGERYDAIPWGHESGRERITTPCARCGTPPDGIHHYGCALEECPACHGPALGCRCGRPDEDDEIYDEAPSLYRPYWCGLHAMRRARLLRHRRRSMPPFRPPVRPMRYDRPGLRGGRG